ncbi:hypothetical protein WJ970_04585 [Achromobacter xylosoxidans]
MTTATPDVIFHNGRITTLDRSYRGPAPSPSRTAVSSRLATMPRCWRWPAPARGAST